MYAVTTDSAVVSGGSGDTGATVNSVNIVEGKCYVWMYAYIQKLISPDTKEDDDSGDDNQIHHDTDGSIKATSTQRSGHSGSVVVTLKHSAKGRVAPQPKSTKRNAGRRESKLMITILDYIYLRNRTKITSVPSCVCIQRPPIPQRFLVNPVTPVKKCVLLPY